MGGCMSALPSHAARNLRRKGGRGLLTAPVPFEDLSIAGRAIKVLVDPNVGDNIRQKYNIGKELGRGEFGITYECTEIESGLSRYACKTISKSKLRTEVDLEDVKREVEIMRHLPRHANIVAFKEAFEDDEAVYLVMELCQGGELFDRIVARGHYSERAACHVVRTIVEVVKVCHEHGVIHRDLKPENFLYANKTESAALKAIDFGLSIFFEPGQRFSEIVGSPYYMAPEVLRRNYGPEVDVWSAGVILYILLCGVPPFWAETDEGIAQAIVNGKVDLERDPWPRISTQAKDLVSCMLEQNPYSRLTVDEVLEHPWIKNGDGNDDISLGKNVMTKIKQFSLMNKFKKKVLRVVADNLPEEQIEKIRRTFEMMDTDENGSLSFDELKEGLLKLGHPLPDSDIQMIFEAADVDGNGMLDCGEFLTLTLHIQKMEGDEHLLNAFKHFDKNSSGYIEFEELREELLSNELDTNSDQVVRDILFDADLDKDGRISYDEFKTMMCSGMDWKMSSRQYSKAMLNKLSLKLFKEKSIQVN
ncbi:calcium-dependent protein kinase 24-like [Silene latifolia]|uniref:calcium-dependent protein kinase 24-like n=1 Tax=Silene latifolia TaxID=37657 RepID=UPI003D785EA7